MGSPYALLGSWSTSLRLGGSHWNETVVYWKSDLAAINDRIDQGKLAALAIKMWRDLQRMGGVDLRKLGFCLNLLGFNLEKSGCYIVNTIPDVFNKKRFHLPCCNSSHCCRTWPFIGDVPLPKNMVIFHFALSKRCEKIIRTKSKTSWNFTWIWHHENLMVYHHVPQQCCHFRAKKNACSDQRNIYPHVIGYSRFHW